MYCGRPTGASEFRLRPFPLQKAEMLRAVSRKKIILLSENYALPMTGLEETSFIPYFEERRKK